MNMLEIRAALDDKLKVGRKVKHKILATDSSGVLAEKEARTGRIEAVYPHIIAVRFGDNVECFSKVLFFSKGRERMRF